MTEPITPELRQQPFIGQPWGPPPHPPAKPRRRWPWVIGIAIAGLTGIAVGAASQTDRAESDLAEPTSVTKTVATAPETVTHTITETATARTEATAPAPAGPLTQFSAGTFEVGTDIKAGKYKTTGPDKSDVWPSCYWARNKDSSGSFESIIANDNIQGPGTVTVNAGEVFEASGSCVWQLAP